MTAPGQVWIGISGWTYGGWRGDFYPSDLPRGAELEFASQRFNSIEINGSFYRLQHPENYDDWYQRTPKNFRFAVKGSRFITHNLKMLNAEVALANFLASGLLRLREKLGPILWQLAEWLRFNPERIDDFLALLPKDTAAAAELARGHDHRLQGRAWTETDRKRPLRHALEVRNASAFVPELSRIARRHGVALVFSDAADWGYLEEITAGFTYLRLHGAERTYASRYSDARLDRLAARVEAWRAGGEPLDAARISDLAPPRRARRDVYIYFDNDQKTQAPKDALRLMRRLGIGHPAAATSPGRGSVD